MMKEVNTQWSTRRCLKMAEALRAFGMNNWESVVSMLNRADSSSDYLDPQLEDITVQDCIDKYLSLVAEESTSSGIEAHPESKDALERVIKMLKFRRIDEVKFLLAENADEIRFKSNPHLGARAARASSPGHAADSLQTPISSPEENSPKKHGAVNKKYPLLTLIDEPVKPRLRSSSPAEKGIDTPADDDSLGADDSSQLRRLRARSVDSDGIPRALKIHNAVKKVYKRASDPRKHTIASRVTTRHDRASKKRSVMLSARLTTSKLAQSSSGHIKKSPKRTAPGISESRKPSKSVSEKRVLRSTATPSKKELNLRTHKPPTKKANRGATSASISSYKSQRSQSVKKLAKPKKQVYRTKADSSLRKTRKYKKGKKFRSSK